MVGKDHFEADKEDDMRCCLRGLLAALAALFGHHTLLTLSVAVGTAAESAYYDLGFLPGPEQVSVYIPAGQLFRAKKEARLP